MKTFKIILGVAAAVIPVIIEVLDNSKNIEGEKLN
jgi:hypothetical protein